MATRSMHRKTLGFRLVGGVPRKSADQGDPPPTPFSPDYRPPTSTSRGAKGEVRTLLKIWAELSKLTTIGYTPAAVPGENNVWGLKNDFTRGVTSTHTQCLVGIYSRLRGVSVTVGDRGTRGVPPYISDLRHLSSPGQSVLEPYRYRRWLLGLWTATPSGSSW